MEQCRKQDTGDEPEEVNIIRNERKARSNIKIKQLMQDMAPKQGTPNIKYT